MRGKKNIKVILGKSFCFHDPDPVINRDWIHEIHDPDQIVQN